MGWGSIVGGITGGLVDVWSQEQQQRDARAAAAKQMEFQERMRNTSHQVEVADLRAAGLNPMLSATHGGAASPVGASYTPEAVGKGAIERAANTARALDERKLLDAQVRKAEQETRTGKATEYSQKMLGDLYIAQRDKDMATANGIMLDNAERLNAARSDAEVRDNLPFINLLKSLGVMSGTGKALSGLTGAVIGSRLSGPREVLHRYEWNNWRR